MLEPSALEHRRIRKWVAWQLFQGRDLADTALLHATAVSEADQLRRLGVATPIAVIPNGVDVPDHVLPSPTGDSKTVLFLSRLHKIKGPLDLVTAWDAVRPPGWRLIIAGPDEDGYRAVVEAAVRRRGLQSSIKMMGSVDGVAKSQLLFGADLFVLPTHSENFGIVVAEAMAHGLPVITTHKAPWSVLTSHQCGWWIPDCVGDLIETLRVATGTTIAERRAMGQRGRRLVQERFGWSQIASDMEAVYRWILDGGEIPAVVRLA
jgi:glycosyltransferase involved in cell wall biosynthesis